MDPTPAGAADTAPALPAPGDRIKVTAVAEPSDEDALYVGALGVVTEVRRTCALVEWDDPELAELALLRDDRWELATDA
jgi:hypothetical protein